MATTSQLSNALCIIPLLCILLSANTIVEADSLVNAICSKTRAPNQCVQCLLSSGSTDLKGYAKVSLDCILRTCPVVKNTNTPYTGAGSIRQDLRKDTEDCMNYLHDYQVFTEDAVVHWSSSNYKGSVLLVQQTSGLFPQGCGHFQGDKPSAQVVQVLATMLDLLHVGEDIFKQLL